MYTIQNLYGQTMGTSYNSIDTALHAAYEFSYDRRERMFIMQGMTYVAEVGAL